MKCICGFKFSGPGEFRNCEAFITIMGQSGVVCPKCGRQYVNGLLRITEDPQDKRGKQDKRGDKNDD
jgi:hypothetical protein